AVVDAVMARFFSEEFRSRQPDAVAEIRARFLELNPEGYAGCCAAIRDMDLLDQIAAIRAPALVVAGTLDMATPFARHGQAIANRIPGAKSEMVDAAHIAPVEVPERFAAIVKNFLARG